MNVRKKIKSIGFVKSGFMKLESVYVEDPNSKYGGDWKNDGSP